MCQGASEERENRQMASMRDRLSTEGRARQMAGLRRLVTSFSDVPGIIGLHGGLPPASAFPITEMTLTLRDGQKVVVDDPVKMAAAQQYCLVTAGYRPLHNWAVRHMLQMHAPPGDHELIITNGNNPTLEVIIRLLLDKGDAMLVEEYTYPHVPEDLMQPQGFVAIPMKLDSHGVDPAYLRRILKEMEAAGKRLPRVMYTVPTGQNPTGIVTPLERKKEIYAICRQYDILLLEDDPYYYLQFTEGGGQPKGLTGLGRSYLSMDVDSRVIRLDSFSKVLSPGLRLGWVTGAPAIIEKIIFHMQGIHVGVNSFTQLVVAELLEAWGDAGFEAHVVEMQAEYAGRAAVAHAAAQEQLQCGVLAEWQPPSAGMFLWLKLLVVPDADAILGALKDSGVVVVPGRFSHCLGSRHCFECPYVRVSYSYATHEELREGMVRLGRVLRSAKARTLPPPLPVAPSAFAETAPGADGVAAPATTDGPPERPPQVLQNGEASGEERAAEVGAAFGRACPGRGSADLRESDSAFDRAQLSLNQRPPPTAKMAQLVVERSVEVMPDCKAQVQLAAGDAGLTEDALASKPAKTVAAAPQPLGA